MRAVKLLQQNLVPFLSHIHLARIKTVFWAVEALLNGGLLTLTGLGRSAPGMVMPKHNIKRIDRMLKNTDLRRQSIDFYRALCRFVIGGKQK